ncbi:DUF2796 domain-containing protein [Maricaulaceae bacterium NA33B04]|nr:DUF2796 domain-containing protein [Maricaulaceae bacterium NA33B04]
MMYRLLLASLTLSAAPAALAQDAMTQLGAHVHGESLLSVGLDPASGELVIEISGPAYNIYGFEREPASAEEDAIVASVRETLSGGALFTLSPQAGCSFETAAFGGEENHDHEDHGHDEHDHGDHDHEHHDHDGHDHGDHHGHDEHHDDHDEHGHSDVQISWSYQCETPTALVRIDADPLFAALTSLEELDASFFDGDRAAAQALTRTRSALVID